MPKSISALALSHLGALFEKLLDLGVNGKRIGIRCQAFRQLGDFFLAEGSVHFVLGLPGTAGVVVPIGWVLRKDRHLGETGGLFLGFVVGILRRLELLSGVGAKLLRVKLPELRVILDARVANRLRDSRVVHFAVPVTTVAEQVDDDIGSECVAVFEREARNANDSVGVLCIHMEDGDRQVAWQDQRRSDCWWIRAAR